MENMIGTKVATNLGNDDRIFVVRSFDSETEIFQLQPLDAIDWDIDGQFSCEEFHKSNVIPYGVGEKNEKIVEEHEFNFGDIVELISGEFIKGLEEERKYKIVRTGNGFCNIVDIETSREFYGIPKDVLQLCGKEEKPEIGKEKISSSGKEKSYIFIPESDMVFVEINGVRGILHQI